MDKVSVKASDHSYQIYEEDAVQWKVNPMQDNLVSSLNGSRYSWHHPLAESVGLLHMLRRGSIYRIEIEHHSGEPGP
jgi:hypothetical protein